MARRPRARGVGGLRLNVVRGPHSDDSRLWYWRIIDNRGGRRETLWSGWAHEGDAEAELIRLAGGGSSGGGRDTGIRTVAQLLGAWLAHLEDDRPDLAASSLREYRIGARRLRELLGSVRVDLLDHAELERASGVGLRRWAPRTVEADLTRLGAAWKWGRKRGACPDRDLPKVKILIPETKKRTPTEAEVARVISHVPIPWRRMGLRLMWATGARIGEIASLTWDRVDWGRSEIEVRGKTGPRLVPLSAPVLAELRAWRMHVRADRPEVLGVTFNSARVGLDRALSAACDAAGVPRWSSHALRRAVVDRLARAGVDVSTAADLLGHTPQVMLDYYRQVSDDDRRKAVARARLGALPEGRVIQMPGTGEEG